MLMSQLLGERYRETPADAVLKSHQFLLRGGYIRPVSAGIFTLLPPAQRILRRLSDLVRQEMDAVGGQEVLFPVVLPAALWEESGRYDSVGQELIRFSDRTERRLVLGMTHEEAAVQLARGEVKSYLSYPFLLYQIQTKFRDELRSRGGLVRMREFTMKDAYSFHTSLDSLQETYRALYAAYERIFARVGIHHLAVVESDPGMMGGGTAHEFMCLNEGGEDSLLLCGACGRNFNEEVLDEAGGAKKCPGCGGTLHSLRGIELGHIFQLGDKYTKSMGMTYTDRSGKQQIPVMGCYGIGLSRLLACVLEENCDERGPIWPSSVAPYQVHLCALDKASLPQAENLYRTLSRRYDVLLDDRGFSAGVQFADADLLGAPLRVVVSKRTLKAGAAELSFRKEGSKKVLPLESVAEAVSRAMGESAYPAR